MRKRDLKAMIEGNLHRTMNLVQRVRNVDSKISQQWKRLTDLENTVNYREGGIHEIKRRLRRLECTHPYAARKFNDGDQFTQVCKDCGKVLKIYKNRRDMLEAKMATAEAEYKNSQP